MESTEEPAPHRSKRRINRILDSNDSTKTKNVKTALVKKYKEADTKNKAHTQTKPHTHTHTHTHNSSSGLVTPPVDTSASEKGRGGADASE